MNKSLPKSVTLCECWARDGLQNHSTYISTDNKLKMIDLLVETGFKRLEVTSFSHPKYVPQFKDAEELVKRLGYKNLNIDLKATCVNEKALDRAIQCKNKGYNINEVSFVIAASEAYNKENVQMSQRTLFKQITIMIKKAKKAGLNILISISTAFGCPVKGKVDKDKVINMVDYFSVLGVKKITIGDTTGEANPVEVYNLFSELKKFYKDTIFIAHFHDTKGWGIANAYSALQAGIDHFDVSLGGVGGPPAERLGSQNENTGNVCTEDFVSLLNSLNISTGLSYVKLVNSGEYSEEILGKQRSQILRSYFN